MARYRKKPVIIEAEQFDPTHRPWPVGVEEWQSVMTDEVGVVVETRYHWRILTPKGVMEVLPNDWIITDVECGRYPVEDALFHRMYTYDPERASVGYA